MQRNMIETLMGFVVLAAAALFLTFVFSSIEMDSGDRYEINAYFNKLGGVNVGSDVRISGISIGSVSALRLDPDTFRAVVTLQINENYQIPEDTAASIIAESLLGGNFIDLVPGGSPEFIEPGGTIEFTQDAIDIVQLLGKFIFTAAEAGKNQ